MAVAFDARSEGEGTTGLTIAHTCLGSNRVLYVAVTSCPGSGVEVDAVSATYNGISMAVFFTDITTHGSRRCRVFRLVAPDTGANNIILTWAGGGNMRAIGASYTGVDQTTPDDAQQTVDGSAGGTSSTVDVSSAAGNMVMDCLVTSPFITFTTSQAGQTLINEMTGDGGGPGYQSIIAQYESGAGTVTMTESWDATVSYVGWAWNINAGTAAASAANAKLVKTWRQ